MGWEKGGVISRRSLLAAGALLAAPLAARAQASTQRLAHLVAQGADSVLGVAVIARDARARPVLSEAHGLGVTGVGPVRRERPFTLDTPVRVASISKLATVAVMMRLVGQGRLSLDEDVSNRLGWTLRHPDFPDVVITPRLLASHLAGLRNGSSFPVPVGYALREAFEEGGRHWDQGTWWSPLGEPPVEWWAYADVNVAVLAQVMERLTGERFDRLVTQLLFQPLGLDAGFNWSGVSQAKRDLASACCRRVDAVWTPEVDAELPRAPEPWINAAPETPNLTAADYRIGENGFAFSPQGGLRASVRDLDRLARAFRDGGGGIVGGREMAQMIAPAWTFTPEAPNGSAGLGLVRSYGLGVQVPTDARSDSFFGPRSSAWRGHYGEAYGLVSGLWWNTQDGRTLAYVINGTPRPAEESPGARTAATPWEDAIFDAALAAWASRPA